MSLWIGLVTVLLLAAVVLIISAPLRGGTQPKSPSGARAQLLAAREAKYREIRDAEMDYRTGKLSEQDFQMIDAELRGEAIKILDALNAEDAGREPATGED